MSSEKWQDEENFQKETKRAKHSANWFLLENNKLLYSDLLYTLVMSNIIIE